MSTQTSLVRRLFALVAVVALFGVALPVTPASAATEACPSTIPSAGYKDLAGLSKDTVEAINCITYYGIAQGVTTTLFDPSGVVPRWQMALFMVRAAEDLGIPLPLGTNQGFTDLAGVAATTEVAINQLTQLGITKGVATGRFAPFDPVPRWQMALFLTRLYAKAGLTLPSGASQGFADIGDLPLEAWYAVNQLSQLGITRGIGALRFGPIGSVYRWQMALFLARQLEAAQASPLVVRLSASASGAPTSSEILLSVSVMTPRGNPVPFVPVDVFVGSHAAGGRCAVDPDAHLGQADGGTGANCVIDASDPKTGVGGTVSMVLTHDPVNERDAVYAWTGPIGAVFDANLIRSQSSLSVTWTDEPHDLEAPPVLGEYGHRVRLEAFLVDDLNALIPLPGQSIHFTVNRGAKTIVSTAAKTDAEGVAALEYGGPPDPGPGDSPTATDDVRVLWDRNANGTIDPDEIEVVTTVTWDDDLPRLDSAKLSQEIASTFEAANATAYLTVIDKFGHGVPSADVEFAITGANPAVVTHSTNSSGVATLTYRGTNWGVDVIDASVDVDRNGSIDVSQAAIADLGHYVVDHAPDMPGSTEFDILTVSPSGNWIDAVTVGTGDPYRLSFDSGDEFEVNGLGKRTMAQFESALGELNALPILDGAGRYSLITQPYRAVASQQSSFVLTTP